MNAVRLISRHKTVPIIILVCAVIITAFAYGIIDSLPDENAVTVAVIDIMPLYGNSEDALCRFISGQLDNAKTRFYYYDYYSLSSAASLEGCTVEQTLYSLLVHDSADIIILDANAVDDLAKCGYLMPVNNCAYVHISDDNGTYAAIIDGTDLTGTGIIYSEAQYDTQACLAVFNRTDNPPLALRAYSLLYQQVVNANGK